MVKLLITGVCLMTSVTASAQLQWEHTYEKGQLSRILLSDSSSRYVLHEKYPSGGANTRVFTAGHDFTGITFIPSASGSMQETGPFYIADKLFDTDAGLEMAFAWTYDGEDVFVSELLQEDNQRNTLPCLNVNQVEGLAPKLICVPRVYDLPGLQEAHSFADIGCYHDDCEIQHFNFPLSGEQYLVRDFNTQLFKVFDQHFQFLREFSAPVVNNTGFLFTQTLFNNDALLEVHGTMNAPADAAGNTYVFTVAQENGNILFSAPCAGYAQPNAAPGLPARILLRQYTAPNQLVTKVLDAKTFATLLTFPGAVQRITPSGGKEYYRSLSLDNNQLLLYPAPDFTPKFVNLGPHLPLSAYQIQFTRKVFQSEDKLELFFSIPAPDKKVICLDEDGNILYTFDKAIQAALDRQKGMADKFFVQYPDSTQVYDLLTANTATQVPFQLSGISAGPNPFQEQFQLQLPGTGACQVQLFDTQGRLIHAETARVATEIRLPGAPAGCYFLRVQNEHTAGVWRLVKG